jgi:uncharacterized protein with HEPN domain
VPRYSIPQPDAIRLRHMLDAALEALSFVAGRSLVDVVRDRQLALSLIKDIETIGEAASKVSPDTQAALPEIGWRAVIATRNRLVHVYFDVDFRVVWETATQDLGPLIAALETALKPEP